MQAADQTYRPDIDGLRAIAVLAVVGFHAFPQWVPGGYVGVDVFFVISGFLISSQLMGAASSGRMSFSSFYARRIRRIFPALLVVLLAVGVAGWWLLLPQEWEQLRTHIGASAIFSNNIAIWSEAGYFDTASELKPLLHLWSLGVEEQFYIVWPMLIWTWWRRDVRWATAIAAIAMLSFAINVMVVDSGAARAAFLLPHTRLWQLGAGAWLAALHAEGVPVRTRVMRWLYRTESAAHEARFANLLSITGTLLVLLSFVALSRGVEAPDWWSQGAVASVGSVVRWIARGLWLNGDASRYPGWSALAPTIGAALIIAAGPAAVVNRAWLSMRAMVFVGLISYPLYLWHWPILSFLQITELGDVSRPLKVVAIVASVVLASITYLAIELPIRRAFTPATLRRVSPLMAGMAGVAVATGIAISTGWLTPPPRTALSIDTAVPISLNENICRPRFGGLGEYCQQFDPTLPVTTALLGDSHAAHFLPGLGAVLASRGETAVHLGQTGCPPLIGIERLGQSGDNRCLRVNRAMIDAIIADRSIVNVWLSFRSAVAMTGRQPEGGAGSDLFRLQGSGTTNAAAIRDASRSTIAQLQSAGKKVGVLLQIPELGFRVDECTGRPVSIRHGPARFPCVIPKSEVMARQKDYRDLVHDLQRDLGISVYDPITTLCDDDACHAVAEGHVLYFDDNHLGVFGSSFAMRLWPQ
jgi:peptidoglycan/LPS O-acetylase OafA/YrhL